jgi:hypothetical protein
MEPIKALLKGPPSYEPGPYIDWLIRMANELGQSPLKHIAAIGRPLRDSADLLVKVNNGTEAEQEAAFGQISVWLVESQGLALYAFLEEFRKAAEAVSDTAKKQKPGTPIEAQFKKLDVAFREVFNVLATTYNETLDGKPEAWNAFPAAFAKAEELVKQASAQA